MEGFEGGWGVQGLGLRVSGKGFRASGQKRRSPRRVFERENQNVCAKTPPPKLPQHTCLKRRKKRETEQRRNGAKEQLKRCSVCL